MNEIILAKYGELALKGLNKNVFEDILIRNIKRRLAPAGSFKYSKMQSTIYIQPQDGADIDDAMERIQTVFGIGAIQRCMVLPKDFGLIVKDGMAYLEEALMAAKTFKVEAKRSDKTFPMNTPQIQIGRAHV